MKFPGDYDRTHLLKRSYVLLALLRHCPRTLAYLAEVLTVSARTVRRDLYTLEAAGLPLEKVESDPPRWRLMKGVPCPICGRGIANGKEYRERVA